MHHFHLVGIHNGFLTTPKSDSQPSTLTLRTAAEKNFALTLILSYPKIGDANFECAF